MISIQNLTKTYDGKVQALRGLDLEIAGRGTFGLLGVNGAGKTTLMRILAGLLGPSQGEVRVFGHDVTTRRGRQATQEMLGYLPQEMGVPPDLTAREFLDYVAILKGVTSKAERARQIDEALEIVRLTAEAGRRLKTYSGGMKRRVGIAQALLGRPRLLIVDEPTAGLDPEERVRFRNLLAVVARRCAVILSTHVVEDVGQSCGDLAVLWRGTALFQGAPGDLATRARGKVWILPGHDGEPPAGATVVSTRPTPGGVEHRVLNGTPPGDGAVPAEPTTEDGYLWLMHQVHNKEE